MPAGRRASGPRRSLVPAAQDERGIDSAEGEVIAHDVRGVGASRGAADVVDYAAALVDSLEVEGGGEPTFALHTDTDPCFQGSGRGHLYVRVQYDVPRRPSRKLKKAIEALREVEQTEPGPTRRKFSDALKNHLKRREKQRRKDD